MSGSPYFLILRNVARREPDETLSYKQTRETRTPLLCAAHGVTGDRPERRAIIGVEQDVLEILEH